MSYLVIVDKKSVSTVDSRMLSSFLYSDRSSKTHMYKLEGKPYREQEEKCVARSYRKKRRDTWLVKNYTEYIYIYIERESAKHVIANKHVDS